jgi:hypothetical protein
MGSSMTYALLTLIAIAGSVLLYIVLGAFCQEGDKAKLYAKAENIFTAAVLAALIVGLIVLTVLYS